MGRYLRFLLLATFLIFAFSGCAIAQGEKPDANVQELPALETELHAVDPPKDTAVNHPSFFPETQQIEVPSQESPYVLIYTALERGEQSITVCGVLEDKVAQTYDQVVFEHPEFFWADYGYSWTVTSGADPTIIELKPKLAESMDTITRKRQQLDAAVEDVLSGVPATATDYEKALYIHDYLVLNTEYDSATYERMQASPDQSIMDDAGTAYGCLVNHLAVCDGYAKAFHLLMNHLGIEAGRVSGIADGGSHAWNYLALDGDYYYIDVTWDDPIAVDGSTVQTDIVSHEYFCITTDTLLLDHSITDNNFFVPICTAAAYEYFRYHGLFLDTYSLAGVEDLIVNKSGNNSVQIEFGSQSELRKAITQLFDNQEIFEIPYVRENYTTVWRSVGNSGRVLTITLSEGG